MPIKIYKPTSPGRRLHSVTDYSVLTKRVKPKRFLVLSKKSMAGRSNLGKITVRHKGGGFRQKIRIVDFDRDKMDIPAKVQTIEYDPTRSAFIALLAYADGEKRYILAPDGLKVGQSVISSERAEIRPGNRMMLKNIPTGTYLHHVGSFTRSAGSFAVVISSEGKYVTLKMPSGEIRKVAADTYATVGQVSNADWMYVRIGKAGRTRLRGIRPTVRGKAMNPVDHPHGGGEGHNPIGMKYPKTPWGRHALGVKTRPKGKASDKFIIKRRI